MSVRHEDKDNSSPDNLAVEKLTVAVNNSSVIQHIKALDPYWVEDRKLTIYECPPSGSEMVFGALEAWRNRMQEYAADVKWLLAMEHHKFWSTVIHHPQCMDMLVSFLQEAHPPYMEPYESRSVQQLYEDIRKLILIVFSRLITNKESKSQWMSKEYMSNIIYDKFIFTIPILWDICLVYGADNLQHSSRLMNSVFTLQPRYLIDLEAAVVFVKEAFKYIILQVNKDYDRIEPPNLPETFGFRDICQPGNDAPIIPGKLTFTVLRDLVVHLLDSVLTLRIFVEVYPKCVDVLKKTDFISSIVQLYEYGIPNMYEKLDVVGDQTSISHTEVQGYIDMARSEIIDIFREILAVIKDAIFSAEGNVEEHVEEYLAVVMEGLSERLLIKDYHSCYPVNEDMELLRQAYPDIDTVKTDFILKAIFSNLDEPTPKRFLNSQSETSLPTVNGHIDVIDNVKLPGTSKDNDIPDNIREESLISEVRDILPHLGDGFILKCLQHYGFKSEAVINSILEGNLAEPLWGLDQSLPIIPEDPLDTKFLETGIQRLNVFDGDKFDIMTRDDVDVSKIHIGKKKSKYKNIKDMLNDKSVVKERQDIYNKYNLVCDDPAMYSDEYDDTYDGEEGGAPRGDDTDDPGRPFLVPRPLQSARTPMQESSEEEVEQPEEAASQSSRSKLEFCVNPEEVRAKREANMRNRNNKGVRPPPSRTVDVVGKPKGHGQEADVLKNRDKKEKHKSSRSNHNRRQGAQWKRTQGMVPS